MESRRLGKGASTTFKTIKVTEAKTLLPVVAEHRFSIKPFRTPKIVPGLHAPIDDLYPIK